MRQRCHAYHDGKHVYFDVQEMGCDDGVAAANVETWLALHTGGQ